MGRTAFTDKMAPALRNEFNDRIRVSGYTGIDELHFWLTQRDVRISRSGVGRYVKLLRAFDASEGHPLARLAQFQSPGRATESELLQRIAELDVQKYSLLHQLQSIRQRGQGRTIG